jgi:hypothetical protein
MQIENSVSILSMILVFSLTVGCNTIGSCDITGGVVAIGCLHDIYSSYAPITWMKHVGDTQFARLNAINLCAKY